MATTPLHVGTGLCLAFYFDFCSLLQDSQLHLRTMVSQVQKGFQAWQSITALQTSLYAKKIDFFHLSIFLSHPSITSEWSLCILFIFEQIVSTLTCKYIPPTVVKGKSHF